ncbi:MULTISPECIES: methylenetetrahydrofolate reductase [Mycobacterium]|uniref:methylenetetrahydrofolate reductase n=1 Tax=Mycobacterium TaxID=1763 RepID=UPI0020109142|nr:MULTISPECIES: methylenetetrahydrofolate reductase [Mycobacterium]UQB93111.1 methylenetetrahydrofolate reductase [Mycobacterium intracellulare]WSE46172.1 methylenetetrahydrofolate reductase [Mycobacterium sp. 3-98]
MPEGTSVGPPKPTPTTGNTNGDQRTALSAALQNVSYEVLPFTGTGELVSTHLPTTSAITITTTESRPGATLELAETLRAAGYSVAPHIAARSIRDHKHLADVVDRIHAAGIDRIFVVGGDLHEPAGCFADALQLLVGLEEHSHQFVSIGIAGYPEGHGSISDGLIESALMDKAPYASEIITQICFHPDTTARWACGVKRRGIGLPIRVGIPGAVPRRKLARISGKLGLGASARFISKQHGMLAQFFLPGGYHPRRLVEGLTPTLASPAANVTGFHLFTFNELQRTEAWRRAWLERLAVPQPNKARAAK